MSAPLLHIQDLRVQVGERVLIDHLTLELWPGQRLAVLGQNGSGKTTLLHTLMGLRPAAGGRISINQRLLATWPRRELARHIGLLFQKVQDEMPSSVYETAMLGRLPYANNWQWEDQQDVAAVEDALQAMQLLHVTGQDVSSLSGGERQRLAIASLWAQNPFVYLLDEPANHLDISFQIKVLQLFRERVQSRKQAFLMATHDINLVSGFCDRVLLLYGDGQFRLGAVDEVMTDEILSEAYQCDISHVDVDSNRIFFVDTH